MAIRLYNAGTGLTKEDIADVLSVSARSVQSYLSQIDADLKTKRKQKAFEMWLACHTQDEIAEALEIPQKTIDDWLKELADSEALPRSLKLTAEYSDQDWTAPLYNVWTFSKKSNGVSHFGNSEQRIVDNLLYLYTQPFEIVVDPFAGDSSL